MCMKQFHWLKLLPLNFHGNFSMLNFLHNSSVRHFSRIIEWEESKPKNNVNIGFLIKICPSTLNLLEKVSEDSFSTQDNR